MNQYRNAEEKQKSQVTVRNSSIELLKVLAILMIVMSHSMPVYGTTALIDLGKATANWQIVTAVNIRYLGQVGNTIFVICSAWFLCNSNLVSGKKILYMIGDCFTVSILWMSTAYLAGYRVSVSECVRQFFPVTLGYNWFISCYILLYAIHPLLNKIISAIDKKTLLKICITMVLLYSIVNLAVSDGWTNYYYYNFLVGFIELYFLTAYMKYYLPETSDKLRVNLIILLIGIAGSIGQFLVANQLGLHIAFFSEKVTRWIAMVNPFCILIAFGVFNLAKSHVFKNKVINYISGLSLLIYIIHENYFIYAYIRNDIFRYIKIHFTLDELVAWILIVAMVSMLGAILLAGVYQSTIRVLVIKICDIIIRCIDFIYESASGLILKLK